MRRIHRLITLILIGLIAGIVAIVLANCYIAELPDFAAKATVAGSVIAFYGIIFTAIYGEISNYYKERRENATKKWDLILPFIRTHYNPWIGSAQSLLSALKDAKTELNDDKVTRVLYLTTLFYGRRLRFIVEAGGLLLLSSNENEKKVMNAYRDINKNFNWADANSSNTIKRVSYLQEYFIDIDKPEKPLVWSSFEQKLGTDDELKVSKTKMKRWLSKRKNIETLELKIETFIKTFKESIDKIYTAWDD